MKRVHKKPLDILLNVIVRLSAFITFFVLIYILAYIFIKGAPHIKLSLFEFKYTSENVSLLPSLITTVMMVFLSLFIAVPLGCFTAVYLVEYARRGNKIVKWVRLTTETLAGIPSIVYGLFGMLFFVTYLKWGFSLLAGGMTAAMMILPLIIRATEEALKAVPDSFREGSLGLGAGKMRTLFVIVLPAAMPGILAGIILATGRVLSETAALVFTAGTMAKIPENLLSSGRTLAVHMYLLSGEGLYRNEGYATAVVLLLLIIGINGLSAFIAGKLTKG